MTDSTQALMSNYLHYFQQIASHHKVIHHSERNSKFGILEANEYEMTCKSKFDLSSPCLFVSIGTKQYVDNQSDNLRERTPISLIILQKYSAGDIASQVSKMSECEQIGYQVIAKIKNDIESSDADIEFDYNQLQCTPVSQVLEIDTIGYLYTFLLDKSVNPNLKYHHQYWQNE